MSKGSISKKEKSDALKRHKEKRERRSLIKQEIRRNGAVLG
jgi:hypothetical protein